MKTLLTCISLILFAGVAHAETLEWNRNTETNMKDYRIYECFTLGCTVVKSASMLQPFTINQPAVGVKPTCIITTTGKVGAVAITARNTSLGESGLSAQLPFGVAVVVPANPTGLYFK